MCARGRVKLGWVSRIKTNGMAYLEYLFPVSIGPAASLFNPLTSSEVSIITPLTEGKQKFNIAGGGDLPQSQGMLFHEAVVSPVSTGRQGCVLLLRHLQSSDLQRDPPAPVRGREGDHVSWGSGVLKAPPRR